MATGQAELAFRNTIVPHQADIAAFLSLPCVTDSGKGYVTGLQSATSQAFKDTEAEYHNYMEFVTRPMGGNGKCDGGFQSIEYGAAQRRDRSLEAVRRVKNIENAYMAQTQANLFGPVIVFSNVSGKGCEEAASNGYDGLETGANDVAASIDQIRRALQYEADQFGVYEAKNRGLRIRCGDTPTEGNETVRSVGQGSGIHKGIPGGDSQNGASSITGIDEDKAKAAKDRLP